MEMEVACLVILWNNPGNMVKVEIDLVHFLTILPFYFHLVKHIVEFDGFGLNRFRDATFKNDLVSHLRRV